ncbi:MAG: chemotaxis protein CheA [ANME-2 cluster archaeon]|jgi:two-component system chemotaxis sensor kinase CheA|nr:chemotaxis protein CheA [ANME-2 cluster archaeon]
MNSDLEKYKDIHVSDMREHLQNMNRSFVELEHDPGNIDLLNEIFRAVHTIKGNSATMEYDDVAHLAHEMENLLDKIRNKEITIDREIMDIFFESFDVIESMIESISNNEEVMDPAAIIEKLGQILKVNETEDVDKVKAVDKAEDVDKKQEAVGQDDEPDLSTDELKKITVAMTSGMTVYEIIVTIDDSCKLKSAKATIVIRNLEKIGDKIAVYPDEQAIKATNPGKFHVILASNSETDTIREVVLSVFEISDVEVKVIVGEDEENHEFDLDSLEEFDITQEPLTVEEPVEPKTVEIKTVKPEPETALPIPKKSETKKPSISPPQTVQNIRVNIQQLDSLMNHIGELVISKTSLEHMASKYEIPELTESVAHLNRIVEVLQEEVIEIRMVPVDQIFSKYPRIIRDLSKSSGKKVRLVIEGGDIELDRTVLDGINDPLVHILRNCVDHGIETIEERTDAGKPEEGTVLLKAARGKNHVNIEISDDGAGINPEVIRKSAISRGLMSEDEAAAMNDDDLVSILFQPGFSTAKAVTDISGRGVGMDVVKRDIDRLGGNIKIYSTPGERTCIRLKLPLTLAIIKALLVRVGNNIYILPINNVLESFRINEDQIKMVDKKETCILRDEVIPLARLNQLFEIESNDKDLDNGLFVIIVEHGDKHVGLIVDELVGQQEVVIKSLGASLGRVQGFAGATIIKDGSVALILDTNSLLLL